MKSHRPLYRATCLPLFLACYPCNVAQASEPATPNFWERLAVDGGYEISHVSGMMTPAVYSHDPASGREVSAVTFVRYRTFSHGIGVEPSLSIKPWLSVGIDGHLQRDFSAPTHRWFEPLGIAYGKRDAFTLGTFIELRPWQRDARSRLGLFLRGGGRETWFDRKLSANDDVVSPRNGYGRSVHGWLGCGYRLALTSSVSIHFMVELSYGIDIFEWRLRLGGGYR